MLRSGGSYNGARLLSPKTIEFMTLNHLPATVAASGSGEAPTLGAFGASGVGFGLGFSVITDPANAGNIGSLGEYAWGGAAGTIFWIDPVEEVVVISMIQLMASPWPLRSDLKATTYQALTSLKD
jgi:CubicO group peptidase (beta-lactamase class C family)